MQSSSSPGPAAPEPCRCPEHVPGAVWMRGVRCSRCSWLAVCRLSALCSGFCIGSSGFSVCVRISPKVRPCCCDGTQARGIEHGRFHLPALGADIPSVSSRGRRGGAAPWASPQGTHCIVGTAPAHGHTSTHHHTYDLGDSFSPRRWLFVFPRAAPLMPPHKRER